jgi:hypothetical protein
VAAHAARPLRHDDNTAPPGHRHRDNAFVEDPVEAFRRNCWISPFFEDDFTELFDAMGVENICFGSDWPHPEGLAEPWSYVDHLPDDLGDAEIAAIMGGNLSRAMKVGVPT